MSLACYSHTSQCTVKNALLWGICRSHFYQVRIQAQMSDRIVHLVLGILEAIPVIGQIISLFELMRVRSFSYRQPVSSIPQVGRIKCQEHSLDFARFWPTELKLLELDENNRKMLDFHIRNAFISGEIKCPKKKFVYLDKSINLPFSIAIAKIDSTFHIILLLKAKFASGGERTIRFAYDVTTGEFLLKKRIVGVFEKEIISLMNKKRESRKISNPVLFWRTSKGKDGKEKQQVIEPIRNGTLTTLFGTAPLAHFSVKRGLVLDLLEDLNDLHELTLSELSLNGTPLPPYSAFHFDISQGNILVFLKNGKWRLELSDFGGSTAHPTAMSYTTGFTPPEYVAFYQKTAPSGINKGPPPNGTTLCDFNLKHAQGRDIWSAGLMILSILVDREIFITLQEKPNLKGTLIAPLPCLQECLKSAPSFATHGYPEDGIKNLTQKALDKDIDQLQIEALQKHPEERASVETLFHTVKQMLKVNPTERSNIKQLLTPLHQELASWKTEYSTAS